MIVRGMETLGFGITATAPTGGRQAALEVTRWGYVPDMTPWAFLHLFGAYERLAPEVCIAAKTYAGIAYSILVGEEETLRQSPTWKDYLETMALLTEREDAIFNSADQG